MPSVADLHGFGKRGADGLPVGPGAVTRDNLDAGMRAQPLLHDIGGASFQDIDAAAGLGVDEDRRVDQAPAQRKIIDSQHAGHRQGREGDLEEDSQRGVPGGRDTQRWQQPRRGSAANSCATALTWAVSRQTRRW